MNIHSRLGGWLLPAIVTLITLAATFAIMFRPSRGEHRGEWDAIGRIPVSAEGRVKPLDTVARNSLIQISGRQRWERDGQRVEAIEWLCELMASPRTASTRNVFRIDHPDLLALLKLEDEKRVRFSFNEIAPSLNDIALQSRQAATVEPKRRDPFQKAVLQLESRLLLFASLARMETPYCVVPMRQGEEWRPLADAVREPELAQHPSAQSVIGVLSAIAEGEVSKAGANAREYLQTLSTVPEARTSAAAHEVLFNRAMPFIYASALYVLSFLLGCAAFLMRPLWNPDRSRVVARCALSIMLVAFLLHTFGLITRMYLQGRPPVTNLYSSAIFIGWAAIILALVAEWFHRLGVGTMVASLLGFGTLIIAHNLSSGGDTMQMMQAVLDTNFWLATHVVVITIGYSATFLAGLLGAIYLIFGALTPLLRGEPLKAIPKMIYGVIAFATITSFVGTVLGGIWADQSWGRFWGWDPKENGAALIVLWNLLILHARWGGMIQPRGVAVLAVGGNIITAWSWFGTNMLGVGLHSYGFMDSAVFWLVVFCLVQLAIMSVGAIPYRAWRSNTVARAAKRESAAVANVPA